eukprot:gnl/MRDRNA2_/MRDRNA2_58725_c0_seq1.p1 gnl/MRDRNA2_/MRDRNA2_58725_c0~~gnl/MRDRNA2_/MRDRNA2_58725_c0_seq1.p1  ORF type:complete len:251 (-),score=51.15 gnl/MRDRNA2_/MRDRNA2_58725_c0_seq1:22-732(-)
MTASEMQKSKRNSTSLQDDVEDFIQENNLDDHAADMLLNADPDVQHLVLEQGNVKRLRIPSAALKRRIIAAKASVAQANLRDNRSRSDSGNRGGHNGMRDTAQDPQNDEASAKPLPSQEELFASRHESRYSSKHRAEDARFAHSRSDYSRTPQKRREWESRDADNWSSKRRTETAKFWHSRSENSQTPQRGGREWRSQVADKSRQSRDTSKSRRQKFTGFGEPERRPKDLDSDKKN